ncbi:hypothetical protein BCR41DRAFT_351762 [Lobosporangium transversale]|uniref:F-box domain-containing protein n=1 Tax=Lobosporangium transversale TaxID=64571 RepID=A0A1Y2GRW5_9FUNG|nr:hypothetical protein BCR41DRAFT_351762 [Lobosporangium transversale]ORZ19213.1 hypothetical protein BCR41DRAFT_351762 [Lobosporangium transversale]|eukprot:XP_021882381.1 hypothetical protein BCR41DRAFT_351762 [Lobosporangium transversale]
MMSSNKLNPLESPEIVSLVGEFLDQDDLLSCIRVSKIFHNTLVKALWKKIIVKSRYPSGEALQNYKQHIEDLSLYGNFPKEYALLQGCVRLKRIGYYPGVSQDSLTPNQLSNLIKAHSSTIIELRLYYSRLQDIWGALLKCTYLENLIIREVYILDDEIDLFFQVCKKLRCLDMTNVTIDQLPSNFLDDNTDKFIFSNMDTIDLQDVCILNPPLPYTSSYGIGMLVRRCPRLRSLNFCIERVHYSIRQTHFDFYKAALLHQPYTLIKLSHLFLISMQLKDEEMAALLKQMTELRQLVVPECDFGPLSLRELLADTQEIWDAGHLVRKRREQRLCDTVEELHFSTLSKRTNGIAQAILSSCPRLQSLWGPTMTVTEVVNGAEWVSTGLTAMDVGLEVDVDQETAEGKDKGRIVYERVRKLTQLRPYDALEYSRLLSFAGLT